VAEEGVVARTAGHLPGMLGCDHYDTRLDVGCTWCRSLPPRGTNHTLDVCEVKGASGGNPSFWTAPTLRLYTASKLSIPVLSTQVLA